MQEYLEDKTFLQKIYKEKIRIQFLKIVLLSFDEKPIKEIQGHVLSGGSLNINGSSPIRRTINFSMSVPIRNINLEEINSDISLNKKIKVFVGYQNPFNQYEKIIWFPCGIFIISSASVTKNINSCNISVQGKDKMSLLDGTAGGVLPAIVTFHEAYLQKDEKTVIYYPTIFEIIKEAVNHWGNENINNIEINDLDNQIRLLVRYVGEMPIYFAKDYNSFSLSEDSNKYPHKLIKGQNAGYKLVDFTYPGELILKPGDTVVTLLNKICEVLTNFEFFYDVNGKFIFQEKKNFLNVSSPLENLSVENYVSTYYNNKPKYEIANLEDVSSLSHSPKYDNIKNDFIVWGKRKNANGTEKDIRYHLAIDTKPTLKIANQYLWAHFDLADRKTLIRYESTPNLKYSTSAENPRLIGKPCSEWREELYRRALYNVLSGNPLEYYDAELLAEWRKIYDTMNPDWQISNFWNPNVQDNPESLDYWLDFISVNSAIESYSIKQIGRRSKVIVDDKISVIYNNRVPDIIFLNREDQKYEEQKNNCIQKGQKFFSTTSSFDKLFQASPTGISAFDKIRELLFQHLTYNTQINISCLPRFDIEPNDIINIRDYESGIIGDYSVLQISLPLNYSGMMSITATEVSKRY